MLGAFRNIARQTPLIGRATPMACFSTSSTSNYSVIGDFEQYMNIVKTQDEDKLVVAFFNAKFSTWGKILAPQFVEMAKSYPQHKFVAVDVDAIPRAAYHADVTDATSIVVMNRDDAFRANIAPEDHVDYSNLINRAKSAIDTFKFDPCVDGQSSWDFHIRRDNLHAVDQKLFVLPK